MTRLKFIQNAWEFEERKAARRLPGNTRGIYVLLNKRGKADDFNVVYVGMAGGDETGIRGRLRAHASSIKKAKRWTHFSAFAVWPNVTEAEVRELEGLIRHVYRKDRQVNLLNRQRRFKPLSKVRRRLGGLSR